MKGYRRTMKRKMQILLVLSSLLLLACSSYAGTDVYLVAQEFQKTLPHGTTVNMWGFAPADATFTDVGMAAVPGPRITLPPGETILNIHLRNDLNVPVSIIIPSMPGGSLVPVWQEGAPPEAFRPAFDSRVHSLTRETAPGETTTYTWENLGPGGLKPGSHLYHSGTHQSVQVPMGLYGAVTKDADVGGIAYPGSPSHDNEALLLFSEIDPILHEAVAPVAGTTPTYGTPEYPTTIDYAPKYFLINGEPYPDALPLLEHLIDKTDNVLVRFFNAGLMTHVPTLQNLYMDVIAEDGNLYPYPKEQYSVRLPAGRTADAILSIAGDSCSQPVYDRRFYLMNNADHSPGGMFTYLKRVNPGAVDDHYYGEQRDHHGKHRNHHGKQSKTLWVSAAEGVLANDRACDGIADLTAVIIERPSNGYFYLWPNGSFVYLPKPGVISDSFTYVANDGANNSNLATVNIDLLPPLEPQRLDVRIAASSDDAEERAWGGMYLDSSDLELTQEYFWFWPQTVGLRFIDVNIPPGATITKAHIQFQADETDSRKTKLMIEGQAHDNAPTFTKARHDISSRTDRTGAVSWWPKPWRKVGEAGDKERTPNIASVIQEVVDRPGWAKNNAIVIIITGKGKRVAESYDGKPSAAPQLHVEYSVKE